MIGIVKSACEVTTIVAKQTGKEIKKRDIQLVDNSNCAVTCTLWGKMVSFFLFNSIKHQFKFILITG